MQIRQLAELRDRGLIAAEEFEVKKRRITKKDLIMNEKSTDVLTRMLAARDMIVAPWLQDDLVRQAQSEWHACVQEYLTLRQREGRKYLALRSQDDKVWRG